MSLVLYGHVLKKCTIEFLKSTCSLGDFGNPDNIGYACSNRKRYIMQNRIPPLSLAHEKLRFPEIPPKLADLTRRSCISVHTVDLLKVFVIKAFSNIFDQEVL